jgi:tetraacyldisaccharide 4'-kinase
MYGIITYLRNKLFDCGIIKQKSHSVKVISVGNIRVGGTGKTPFVEYLIKALSPYFNLAILSRGYGRKMKGFIHLQPHHSASEVGDEPLLIYKRNPNTLVAVCEERNKGVENILKDSPQTNLIILDDAYQHRYINRDINILLTEYNRPFFKDRVIPYGRLREYRKGYKRASYIVVTKCPPLNEKQKQDFVLKLKPLPHQKIFFSNIVYKLPYHIKNKEKQINLSDYKVLLLTGIANNQHIIEYLNSITQVVDTITFSDHHNFTEKDKIQIKNRYNKFSKSNTILLTTEKDAMRLQDFETDIYVLPIDIEVHQYGENNQLIEKTIQEDVK